MKIHHIHRRFACYCAILLGLFAFQEARTSPYTTFDSFTTNATNRAPGKSLRGLLAEVGGETWSTFLNGSQQDMVVFADNCVVFTNTTVNQQSINIKSLPPSSGETLTLRARIRPTGSDGALFLGFTPRNDKLVDWGHVYFSVNAAAQTYGVFSKTNNNAAVVTILANGNSANVTDWTAWMDVSLAYTRDANALTVKVNGTTILNSYDFDNINFTPNIQYASFFLQKKVKVDATLLPGVDSFELTIPSRATVVVVR